MVYACNRVSDELKLGHIILRNLCELVLSLRGYDRLAPVLKTIIKTEPSELDWLQV